MGNQYAVDWNEEKIVKAYKEFIREYKYFPTKKDIESRPDLPLYQTIKDRTGLNMYQFKRKYFPTLHYKNLYDYREEPHKYIEAFKKKYKSFGRYVGGKEYNKLKLSKEPSAYQLTVLTNSKNWNSMLEKLGLKEKIDDTVVLDEVVSTHKNNEQIQSIITKLDGLIEEVKI